MPINALPELSPGAPVIETNQQRILRRLFLVVCVISLILEFVLWAAFLLSPLRYRTDFRQLYVAGYMARSGHLHQLYDLTMQRDLQNTLVSPQPEALPFIRPAYAALFYAPLAFFPYSFAYFLWLVMNVLLLAVSIRLISGARSRAFILAPTALIAFSFVPVDIALMQGQDSILLLLLFSGAFCLLVRNCDVYAGMLLAVGLFKFQLVVPVCALFFLKARWRFVAGFAAAASVVCAVCAWLVGASQLRAYVGVVNMASSGYHKSLGHEVFWTKMANLHGLSFGLLGSHFSPQTIYISAILLSAMVFALISFAVPKNVSSTDLLLLGMVAAVFCTPYAYAHDLTILLLPILIIVESSCTLRGCFVSYSALALVTAMLLQFIIPNHFYLIAIVIFAFLGVMVWSVRVAFISRAEGFA